jgi:hypothetical protein
METRIVDGVTKASKGLGMVELFDGRQSLKKNTRGKKWKTRDVEGLKGMVWHQELGWGSVEGVAEYHTGRDSHLQAGGVESIAYTFAIRRNGQIVLCNDFERAVWSQGFKGRSGDENTEFMSVMFEGLFNGPGVTDADLHGHYHFGKPACPGDTIGTLIESVRANLEEPEYDFNTVEGRQQALKDEGYYAGAVDGVWGPWSRGALIRFQEEHDLLADGIWGARTEAAMVVAARRG